MLYNALKLVHVLSITVWVGGMVFAHFFCGLPRRSWSPRSACG
jgi:putative copper export protein